MKTLYLVRHAKSSWDNTVLDDIDRPLNEKGYSNAHFMGHLLSKEKVCPDMILTSPAIRAATTSLIFSRHLNYAPSGIKIAATIYESDIYDHIKMIAQHENKINTIMLFGHNPTITDLANFFIDDRIENIPTCGFAGISFAIKRWEELKTRTKGTLVTFDFPKNHQQ